MYLKRPTQAQRLALAVATTLLFLWTGAALAQQPQYGRIAGQILDAETGRPLTGARIRLQGTRVEVLAGLEGRYSLVDLPPGTHSISVLMVGYASKTVTGIEVPAGGVVRVDVTLQPIAVVEEFVVSVSADGERGSVNRALNLQRTAIPLVNALSAEQISRSPDGDAAAAVQRLSGVTVKDGRYVLVRGLGERYSTISLNGARLPSPDPEKKIVPLDLFPSGLLEMITTTKSFTPDQPGDFGGAQVDLRTRDFAGERHITFSAGGGLNTLATGRSIPTGPSAGLEWLALSSSRRSLPDAVASAGNFDVPPSQEEMNAMVRAFRNAWSVRPGTGDPNASFSLSLGGSDPVLGQRIGYLISGTYSRSQEVRDQRRRANALPTPGGGTMEVDRFQGTSSSVDILWGGIANFHTLLGANHRISVQNTLSRTAEDEARVEVGFSENLGGSFQIDRLRYVERSVRSNQISGEHQLGRRHRLDWSLTSSGVTRKEPDRSEFVYALDFDPVTSEPLPPAWFSVASEGAVRTFGDLAETSWQGTGQYQISLGDGSDAHQVRIGGLYRYTRRTAENRAYSITAYLDRASRELPPEQIFDGRFSGPGDSVFRITPMGIGGSYEASDHLAGAFVLAEVRLARSVRLMTGARIEHSDVKVLTEPTVGRPLSTRPRFTDILPSLSLTVKLSDDQNLRLSGSQTIARPEYRELAPVQVREVLGGDNVLGSPELKRARIRNLDLRWEWFAASGEVLSLGLFAKQFENPIEQIFLATSGTRIISFANAESASNLGLEVEVRKNLDILAEALAPFTLFANATLMKSSIRIGKSAASKTNDQRGMVGQAPYVLNTGLSYTSPSANTSATLLFQVVGRRIASASEAPLPDIYEEPRPALDLSLRFPIAGTLSGKLDFKNLLDAPYRLTQGTVIREYYRSGRIFSVGLRWER